MTQTTEKIVHTLPPAEFIAYLKENYTEKVSLYLPELGHYVNVDKEDFMFCIENANYIDVQYQYTWSLYGNKLFIRIQKNK